MKKSLVLWDIESVFFVKDVQTLTSLTKTKEKQVKFIFMNKKNKNIDLKLRLTKFRQNNWNFERVKKNSDTFIIKKYEQYKEKITELFLITTDSDFLEIINDAKKRGIKVTVINNANHENAPWYKQENYIQVQ